MCSCPLYPISSSICSCLVWPDCQGNSLCILSLHLSVTVLNVVQVNREPIYRSRMNATWRQYMLLCLFRCVEDHMYIFKLDMTALYAPLCAAVFNATCHLLNWTGSDFIKTSTGKEVVNATYPVAIVMVRAIRDYYLFTGQKVKCLLLPFWKKVVNISWWIWRRWIEPNTVHGVCLFY